MYGCLLSGLPLEEQLHGDKQSKYSHTGKVYSAAFFLRP